MSAKSPDTTEEAEDSLEMLDWEIENNPVEEKDQKTLSDTESKLTDFNQGLVAVRKDLEEYKATNDAKWEALENRKRQAEDSGFEGPAAKARGGLDPAQKALDSLAKPEKLSDSATKPNVLLDPATQTQDALIQKIAELEAALHSKASQVSQMEQEHEETVRLMSEQLDNVYERLNPDSQPLEPQEFKDARYETLEERNKELQSIIQINMMESERALAKEQERQAVLLVENSELKDRLAVSGAAEYEMTDLAMELRLAKRRIETLEDLLETEREGRRAGYKEVDDLRDVMLSQAQELKELRDGAKTPDIF